MQMVIEIPEENAEKLRASLSGLNGRVLDQEAGPLPEWVKEELDRRLAEDEADDIPLEVFLDRYRERGL